MTRLLTTREVAELLAVSDDYVRAHAHEFGAFRIGGPNGPLRFEPDKVQRQLELSRVRVDPPRERRRPGPRRTPPGVELLPLPGDGRVA